MKKLFALVACASAAGFLGAASFDVTGFSKSLEITVPRASVAQGVTLADFPALVRLSTSIAGFSYSDFQQQNGADLVFLDSQGEVLAHEIDTWDDQGESLVWVKVPALSRGTRMYMLYGNPSYSHAVAATNTWSGFTGVWHMKEASGAVADATGHNLTATPSGARAAYNIGIGDGVVGKARRNGGNASNGTEDRAYLSIPNYDSFALGSTFTASGFFRITASSGWYRLFSRRGGGGWGQEVLWSDARTVYVYGADGPAPSVSVSGLVGNWVHLAFVYNGSECKVYANGALLGTLAVNPATDNGLPLSIGCNSSGDEWCLYGDYDEVRLSGGNLSAERIAADYATATDANFFTYGTAGARSVNLVDPSAFTKFMQLTASASAVPNGEVLNDFPALVRLSTAIPGFSYADFLSGGADLTFATAGGIVLSHEIDTWNSEGESLVWVRIPAFAAGTAIYAYWGGASGAPVSAADTWRSFKGVWHMNQGGSTNETDVSGNGLAAVPTGVSADHVATMKTKPGVVGTSRRNQEEYDSHYHNRLLVPSYILGDTFTVSGWFYQKFIYSWHRILTRKESAGGAGWHVEWDFEGTEGAGTRMAVLGDGSKSFGVDVGFIKDSWTHLAFVYEGTTARVYTNGALCAVGVINAAADNGEPLAIGGSPNGTQPSFEGLYDEVRLGAGALPAERMAADYATVHDAAFFSFGPVGAPAVDPPVFDAPTIVNDSGTLKISVSMISGTGTPYVRFTSGAGSTDVALSGTAVTGPQSYVLSVPGTLAADTTYSFAVVGVNSNGGEVVSPGTSCLYTGAPAVTKVSDAAENGPVAGTFSVSRVDSHGDLAVAYELSGTAAAGVDYEGAAGGMVVIPDGATSATVSVMPKVNAARNEDSSVTISVVDGLYGASASTAALTIVNLAPVSREDFKRRVEFSFPMSFLGNGETLTNFPVLIRLSTAISGFSYSDFQIAGGGDMMFTDSSGNPIPHEVDTWDAAGTSLVWVSVPALTKGTVVKMYYGNGANPAGISLAKWPGFTGVWHMGEESGTAYDSTANGFDAIAVQNARARASDLVATADGAVGAARVNQAGTTWYDVGTYDAEMLATARRNYLAAPSECGAGLGTQLSFSGWFRTTGGTEWTETMVCKRVSGYNYGWSIARKPSTGVTDVTILVNVADGGGEFTIPDMRNNWVHLFVSIDREATGDAENPYRSAASVYANGELLDGNARGSTRIRDNDYAFTFGGIDNTEREYTFYGQYDELRLKSGASSANWAKAEYRTVADASFATPSSAMPAVTGMMVIVR